MELDQNNFTTGDPDIRSGEHGLQSKVNFTYEIQDQIFFFFFKAGTPSHLLQIVKKYF